MSQFHLKRLRSGLNSSNQVPIQDDWAFAINKQARLILVPLFRQVIVGWYVEGGVKYPKISELAEELYRGLVRNGDFPHEAEVRARKEVESFFSDLNAFDKSVLKFYFWSSEKEMDKIFQTQINSDQSEINSLAEDQLEVGKAFLDSYSKLTDAQLEKYVLEELCEIENIISSDALQQGLDVVEIFRINELFCDYLGMQNGEIELVKVPLERLDYWETVFQEERKTIGKKLAHDESIEWLECWLLPGGDFKVKGDLGFPEERDHVVKSWIKEELESFLILLETRLIERYGLQEQDIRYTFFTNLNELRTSELAEGIEFFIDQVDKQGSYGYPFGINFHLVPEIKGDHKIWGSQTSFSFDKRMFVLEDQMEPILAWVVKIEGEIFQLEAQLSMIEKERLVQSIFDIIDEEYLKNYGI